MEMNDVLSPEGASLPCCMRHFVHVVFALDWLHPGDVGIVIEFDQLFQEQDIILKMEIDDA